MRSAAAQGWFARSLRRFDRLIVYGAVGIGIAVVQMALTALLTKETPIGDASLASVAASAVTIPLSFFVHKRTTYADVAHEKLRSARFLLTAASSILVAAGTIKIVQMLGGPLSLAIVLGSALVPIGNYAVNTLWVFRAKSFFSTRQNR
jgi:putative flippase GtrA